MSARQPQERIELRPEGLDERIARLPALDFVPISDAAGAGVRLRPEEIVARELGTQLTLGPSGRTVAWLANTLLVSGEALSLPAGVSPKSIQVHAVDGPAWEGAVVVMVAYVGTDVWVSSPPEQVEAFLESECKSLEEDIALLHAFAARVVERANALLPAARAVADAAQSQAD